MFIFSITNNLNGHKSKSLSLFSAQTHTKSNETTVNEETETTNTLYSFNSEEEELLTKQQNNLLIEPETKTFFHLNNAVKFIFIYFKKKIFFFLF